MKSFAFLLVAFSATLGVLFADLPKETLAQKSENETDILLLLALPASGKSEIRRYLSSLPKEELRAKFGIKNTIIQIDDFPYVHLMRRISEESVKLDQEGVYFLSAALPFKDPHDWGTLMELVNADFRDLVNLQKHNPPSAARFFFDRLDKARSKAGLIPAIGQLSVEVVDKLAQALEADAQKILNEKNAQIPDSLEDATLVMEFSRGGPDRATFPLPAPYGYQFALSKLNGGILKNASILYIGVSADEARRKNEQRADPNDPGSLLHHGVPQAVMYCDYGCDDIDYLLKTSPQKNCISITQKGKNYSLPVAYFSNKEDFTSFLRKEPSEWKKQEIAQLQKHLDEAFLLGEKKN